MRIPIVEKYKNKIGFYFNSPIKKGSKRDFVFIHIPKTGGTSIVSIFGEAFQKHNTSKEVIDQIGKERWNEAYKFSVVRNPWDRIHSWYKFRVKHDQQKMRSKPISFKDWVACTLGEPKDLYYYYRPKTFMQQMDWIENDEGRIDMDRIIRFENLQADFDLVANDVGIRSQLPHINKTTETNYRDFYDEKTKQLVADWHQKDIQYFGYEF